MDKEKIQAIRDTLNELYGARLKGVVLFGSRARGDVDDDSDLDLLVLLEGPVDFGTELRGGCRVLPGIGATSKGGRQASYCRL